MNWYKKAAEVDWDSFWKPTDMTNVYNAIFKDQDYWAGKSEVFKKILQSEIKDDPKERYESTNNPKSKTRNALIIRGVYKTIEEWEKDLLTNPFYQI